MIGLPCGEETVTIC